MAEGQFVATYKYALLLPLADIAVESGDDGGASLTIPTKRIAEKFIRYYWRQVAPYVPRSDPAAGQVLRQNTGGRAAIIRHVTRVRRHYNDSLADAQRYAQAWKALVRDVDQVVRQMPLWKLQMVGRDQFDFLYENRKAGASIELRPGVAYCLRRFYPRIGDLAPGGLDSIRPPAQPRRPWASRPREPSEGGATRGGGVCQRRPQRVAEWA